MGADRPLSVGLTKHRLGFEAVKRLILVSDSNPAVIDALSSAGDTLDLTVVADVQGKLLERARKQQPHLVILDIQQKDGLELLSLLKTGLSTRNIPVVVVAEDDSSSLREMALEIGADAFVAKPLGADFLPKVITFLSSRLR